MGRMGYDTAKKQCCDVKDPSDIMDCDAAGWPKGEGFNIMLKYARDEKLFFANFHMVWQRATSENTRTAVYKLKDGESSWGVKKIDWGSNKVTFAK